MHCVQDTFGARLVPDLAVQLVDAVVEKGQDARVEMYSAFADPFGNPPSAPSSSSSNGSGGGLELLLKKSISHVFIVGLAAEYCVRHTALHAQRAGFHTLVVFDAVRAVDPLQGWAEAETELKLAGVRIVALDGPELDAVRRRRRRRQSSPPPSSS